MGDEYTETFIQYNHLVKREREALTSGEIYLSLSWEEDDEQVRGDVS